nr:fibronectin type III-like domain-contianing protein [Kitasatospora sp. DSM 101779]
MYLARPGSAAERPVRRLAGFAAVRAEPGRRAAARIEVAPRALAHWPVEERRWPAERGVFTVLVGPSCGEVPMAAAVEVVRAPAPDPGAAAR